MGCVVKPFSGFQHHQIFRSKPIQQRTTSNRIHCSSKYGNFLELKPEHHPAPLTGFDLPPPHPRGGGHDLVVIGAGPAGLRLAEQASVRGMQVCVVDPSPLSAWPNNYGCWVDELAPLGLSHCLDHTWPTASVLLHDDQRKRLQRPYGRLDRAKLKSHLLEGCLGTGRVSFHRARAVDVSRSSSVVACDDGRSISGSVVADASGFHSRFVAKARGRLQQSEGFQVAHGILAEVDSHPFDPEEMVLMDWRDSHLHNEPRLRAANRRVPTFLYVMPLDSRLVFLEETSLVGRPALPYQEVKERMAARLRHLGIRVRRILEDEKCVIPMGGPLPRLPQSTLAVGGAAGAVHPSTGYAVARSLRLAGEVAAALGGGGGGRVWEEALWPPERRAAREFYAFGMETLLKLDLEATRSFFAAFFELEAPQWHGFLSSTLTLPELASLSLSLFIRASPSSKLDILTKCPLPLANMLANLALDYLNG